VGPAQRNKGLAFGLLFLFLPILLWVAVPDSLVVKAAVWLRADERLVEAYSLVGGALSQLAAIYFFNRIGRPPWNWLSVCAVATGVVSVLAIFVFFGAVTAVTLHGWQLQWSR
jgi:hypothetical protein